MAEKYYVVKFQAFAFETKEKAKEFEEKLTNAFCAMPEAEGICATSRIVEVEDED